MELDELSGDETTDVFEAADQGRALLAEAGARLQGGAAHLSAAEVEGLVAGMVEEVDATVGVRALRNWIDLTRAEPLDDEALQALGMFYAVCLERALGGRLGIDVDRGEIVVRVGDQAVLYPHRIFFRSVQGDNVVLLTLEMVRAGRLPPGKPALLT